MVNSNYIYLLYWRDFSWRFPRIVYGDGYRKTKEEVKVPPPPKGEIRLALRPW
jgi:hypothetical protein